MWARSGWLRVVGSERFLAEGRDEVLKCDVQSAGKMELRPLEARP